MGTVPAPKPPAGGASGRCGPTQGASHTGTSPDPSGRRRPKAGRAFLSRQRLQLVTAPFPERHAEKACVPQPGLARNRPSDDSDYGTAALESTSLAATPGGLAETWSSDVKKRVTMEMFGLCSVSSQGPPPTPEHLKCGQRI